MSNDSPLFDRIRVKPDKDRRLRAACARPANGRAARRRRPIARPRAALREKEYWRFCLAHVREYNHSYNFFAGMSTDDIARYQRDAVTGHRPTWKMGMNGGKRGGRAHAGRFYADRRRRRSVGLVRRTRRPGARADAARREARVDAQCRAQGARCARPRSRRHPRTRSRCASRLLVKRHHPDANGGDRSSEDKLREIIQAYNYLKSIGFR